jgi:signal transduction histidine kinase
MEEAILVWALGRDGPLTCRFLQEAGFAALACSSWEDLLSQVRPGAGALIVAGELISPEVLAGLKAMLNQQPPWSDLMLIVVGVSDAPLATGADSPLAGLPNVAVLHRPLSLETLSTTVGSALRARRRQYQVRDLLRHREESERRKDEFLAMLAHELRNPLAPIRTGVEVLRLRPDEETAKRTLASMERQLAHLARLVDDLLDVSRITRGKITLQKRPLDLGELLRHVAEGLAPLAAEKGC